MTLQVLQTYEARLMASYRASSAEGLQLQARIRWAWLHKGLQHLEVSDLKCVASVPLLPAISST